jgi:hypothetical protein
MKTRTTVESLPWAVGKSIERTSKIQIGDREIILYLTGCECLVMGTTDRDSRVISLSGPPIGGISDILSSPLREVVMSTTETVDERTILTSCVLRLETTNGSVLFPWAGNDFDPHGERVYTTPIRRGVVPILPDGTELQRGDRIEYSDPFNMRLVRMGVIEDIDYAGKLSILFDSTNITAAYSFRILERVRKVAKEVK